jgi:4-hydroxyphenylpyruvate dioxygenase
MRMAIATVCLSGVMSEKLEAIQAAGFEAVEIFENDLLTFPGSPAELRQHILDLGLNPICFQPFRDFEGMTGQARDKVFARMERKFDVMQQLGTDLLLVCSNVSPDAQGGIDRAADDFRELGERAAKRGLRVGFEALAWGRHINDYRDSWEVVRRADHPNIGIILDSFHILSRGTDLAAMRSIPKDKIFLVQIADAPKLDMDLLSWSRHYRCFPGQGDLPLLPFMEALSATGYEGYVSHEIFNDRFRAGSARMVAIDGRRSLISLFDQLQEKTGKREPDVPPMPPRVAPKDVAFVEFTVDETTKPAFEGWLHSLGFRRSGQHISKAVTRFTQGAINIIVNAEKEGFAHSFNITHGTAVCVIGLEVDNAQATITRAKALLDPPFQQPVGPGELSVPTIRGVGGGLMSFLDKASPLGKVFDIEFTTVTDDQKQAGLSRIDHVSQSVHFEEMLTWLLFYTSLFELNKSPTHDVLDPGGVVASQALQSADGAVRLILNASQSANTQSSRFLTELFGSGVQHIALATDDIFASVEAMVENGVQFLVIPENYYDDLEARTDLPSETIDRMRKLNILYDREGGADYFQIYTPSFAGTFFFEIVQRRGYDGYGAVNAPIRLAAQSRAERLPILPRK